MTTIAERYRATQKRIAIACDAAERQSDEVELLVVTKFHPLKEVLELVQLGVRSFGENREQEARQKSQELKELNAQNNICGDKPAEWSMIGQLQSNKCNAVARWAHNVHSVDSMKLVRGLGRGVARALEEGTREDAELGIFLQVSIDDDHARGGTDESDIFHMAECAQNDPHLRLKGVMAVPPLGADPDFCFDYLYQISERLQVDYPQATEISAGMTNDLEAAIRHGSTCVRVGTAILGPRPPQH